MGAYYFLRGLSAIFQILWQQHTFYVNIPGLEVLNTLHTYIYTRLTGLFHQKLDLARLLLALLDQNNFFDLAMHDLVGILVVK